MTLIVLSWGGRGGWGFGRRRKKQNFWEQKAKGVSAVWASLSLWADMSDTVTVKLLMADILEFSYCKF